MIWPFKKAPPLKSPESQKPLVFPPVPKWRPEFLQPIESIIDRMTYYTNSKCDFAVFQFGTCVILPSGLSEIDAANTAREILSKIYNYHADMNPRPMDDGNITVQYNHPALNIVLNDFAQKYWVEIDRHHQDALATSEVLLTPLGPNKFDDFGKKALFGRCFMFMDAQAPQIMRIVRAKASPAK